MTNVPEPAAPTAVGDPAERGPTARAPRPALRIVLGIDPGTRVVGYGAVVIGARGTRLLAAGCLRAERGDDVPARLAFLRRELDRLLEKIRPGVVVVEAAFAARNVQS